MAPILDCRDPPVVAGIRPQWQSGDGRHDLVNTVLGAPGGAFIVGDIGLRDFWCSSDSAGSISDAQALLKICFCVGGCTSIEQ